MSMSSLKYFGNIGERRVDMNKQIKNLMLVVMAALLLAACGPFETASAPVVENPTITPEPVVSDPVEVIPTEIPVDVIGPEQFSKYIGLEFRSLPENLSQGFWMQIQDKEQGYSLMFVSDGPDKMLWLEKITQYDADGSASWEVKDVLGLSDLEPGLTLIPDGCSLNGMSDSEIFIVGRNGVIVLAWRANTTLGKFEPIPVDGIECDSDKATPL